jgi:leader peptidase (prepilin peptidase)/N-methyltransferase
MTSLRLANQKAAAALFVAFVATLSAAAVGQIELLPASTLLALGLSWAAMIDLDRFILPDALTLTLTACGLGLALANGPAGALPFVIGAAAGYASLATLAFVYRRLRGRSGLGLGDAKLLAVSGAWLGWTWLPMTVLLASLSCLAFVIVSAGLQRRAVSSGPVPFGPHIAGATWLLWLIELGVRA